MPQPTKIKSIRIKNVKGIAEKTFKFQTPEMLGNKFHVLVAPNGFGKSSFASAFRSLRPMTMKLAKGDFHSNDETLAAELELVFEEDGHERTLLANSGQNQLHREFSVSVINCRLKPKAIEHRYNPQIRATAEFIVEPVELLSRIPERPDGTPNTAELKRRFGANGKILPSIDGYLKNSLLLADIVQSAELIKFTQKTVWIQLGPIIDSINACSGSAQTIKDWIDAKLLDKLKEIGALAKIASFFEGFEGDSEIDRFLIAIEIGIIHRDESKLLGKLRDWHSFLDGMEKCKGLMASLNSNPEWIEVRIKKTQGRVVVEFPPASHMSNGQRDLFSFVAQLLKAEFELKQSKAILVVDEVFDYLDDANLLAAQYYVSEFIGDFKRRGGTIFPLFLTHLDPTVFRHSVFGLGKGELRKVHMLDQAVDVSRNSGIALMVRKRSEPALEAVIGKYLFHYHPDGCDESELFEANGLKRKWGKSEEFYAYVVAQLEEYLSDANEVDFMAVCVAVRVTIEKCACEQLNADEQSAFTEEYDDGTSGKLDFAERHGAIVPESHKILGLLYNDMLHHKEQFDYISLIVSKMRNPAIRGMIKEAFKRRGT